jgi:hypothetical protein
MAPTSDPRGSLVDKEQLVDWPISATASINTQDREASVSQSVKQGWSACPQCVCQHNQASREITAGLVNPRGTHRRPAVAGLGSCPVWEQL